MCIRDRHTEYTERGVRLTLTGTPVTRLEEDMVDIPDLAQTFVVTWINTWKTGVCRALKQYIVDGTKSKGKCPSCGQENMAYQNGCQGLGRTRFAFR